jgi:hypothetical protein
VDFPAWLAALGTKLDDIQASLQNCADLAQAQVIAAQALRGSASATVAATHDAEGRGGHLYACNALAFDTMVDLFHLYHDVEMVASWDYALARAGVDPNQVVSPISGNIGGGMGYRLEQSAPLEIFPSPGSATDVVAPGQAGMAVPLRLQILNRQIDARLGLSCDLFNRNASPAIVELELARLPRLKASEPLSPSLVFQIEDRARSEITSALARARIMTPLLDILPSQPQFWGAYDDGLIRVVGHIGRRGRSRRPFISALPAGFPVALRFDLSIITRLISDQIAAFGVSLFSGPVVTSPKTFRFVAGSSASYSVRIGCDVASASVTIRVTIDTTLSVRFGNRLSIEAHPVGAPDVEVNISPRIPLLTDWVEGQVARIVRDFVPQIDGFGRDFFIAGVSSFDIWLSQEHTTFGVVPAN